MPFRGSVQASDQYILLAILVLQFDHSQEAAMEMGTWPQSGGPQGSLGETLKSWTNQAGLPLVSAA